MLPKPNLCSLMCHVIFFIVDFFLSRELLSSGNFSHSQFFRHFLSISSLNSLCRHSQFIYIFTTQHTFLHTQQAKEKKDFFLYGNFPTRKMKMKKKWKTRKIFSNWLLQSTFVFTAIETHFRVFCEREEKFGKIKRNWWKLRLILRSFVKI